MVCWVEPRGILDAVEKGTFLSPLTGDGSQFLDCPVHTLITTSPTKLGLLGNRNVEMADNHLL
jgi:hypothetical protein